MGLEGEIEDIREETSNTPHNKSTEVRIGRLKMKLTELKEKLENQGSADNGQGYAVEKTGDATVVLVGFPSVGKSTLVDTLTNVDSEIGEYGFTTLNVNPGMLRYKGTNIQILDVPGLIEGAAGGRGGGKEVLSVIHTTGIIVFILSIFEIECYERLQQEPYNNKIRLDTSPPDLFTSKKGEGGIGVTESDSVDPEEETIKGTLREYGFVNAEVTFRGETTIDELVGDIMESRVHLPSIVAVNKVGLIDEDYFPTVEENLREVGLDPDKVTFIGAEAEKGLGALKEEIWDTLGPIRIYVGKPGRGTNYDESFVLQRGDTIDDATHELGVKLDERFRFVHVSGPNAKHDGQQVGRDHILADGDMLRIIAQR